MVNPEVIGYEHIKYLYDSGNCEVLTLYYILDYATVKSMHTQANVDYVVPAGKIAIVVGATASCSSTETVYLWDGSVDSSAGTMKFRHSLPDDTSTYLPLYLTFSAGNYINCQCPKGCTLVVIEVDT